MLQTAQSRILERLNWRTVSFLLENAVFLLIGLQARWIIEDVGGNDVDPVRIVAVCGLTLLAVIVLRMVWVLGARFALKLPGPGGRPQSAPTWGSSIVLGWAGMRGVVTLATAFVIPEDVEYREILLLVAFTVVASTLFLQGLSLPWLARRLRTPAPDVAEEESPRQAYARARRAMIQAERERVLEVRSTGQVPAEVVAGVLAMLDIEETTLQGVVESGQVTEATVPRDAAGVAAGRDTTATDTTAGSLTGGSCGHLEDLSPIQTAADPVCRPCIEEGTAWVALRECLTCGHVGCCDSSLSRHATAHFVDTAHPVIQSAEPQETWRWCFVDHLTA